MPTQKEGEERCWREGKKKRKEGKKERRSETVEDQREGKRNREKFERKEGERKIYFIIRRERNLIKYYYFYEIVAIVDCQR